MNPDSLPSFDEWLKKALEHADNYRFYPNVGHRDKLLAHLAAHPSAAPLSTAEDANNYCRILTLLGMEEEGDPVAEVERLISSAAPQAVLLLPEQPQSDKANLVVAVGKDLPPALPANVEAVLNAARNWWGERQIQDWDEAELVKAVMSLDGDWPGCPGCDHECDEPCMPFTVAEGHRAVDCRIAQLVFDGKLPAYTGYTPPEGWKPDKREQRRKAAREQWAIAREARVEPVEGSSSGARSDQPSKPLISAPQGAPSQSWQRLYTAVSELMAYMGAHGSADAKGDRASAVMDALHAIDGGHPAAPQGAQPVQEPVACNLCAKGFPLEDGEHYGTQALGMIPNTRCTAQPADAAPAMRVQQIAMTDAQRDGLTVTRDVSIPGFADAAPVPQAARDVLAERKRQVDREGWTPAHDDQHNNDELAEAAACYAHPSPRYATMQCPVDWPWDVPDWKPKDRRSNLVRAGALILAEIERLDRAV